MSGPGFRPSGPGFRSFGPTLSLRGTVLNHQEPFFSFGTVRKGSNHCGRLSTNFGKALASCQGFWPTCGSFCQWNSIGSNGIPLDPMEFHWQKDPQVGQKPWQLARAFPKLVESLPQWLEPFRTVPKLKNGSWWFKTVPRRLRVGPNERKPGPDGRKPGPDKKKLTKNFFVGNVS